MKATAKLAMRPALTMQTAKGTCSCRQMLRLTREVAQTRKMLSAFEHLKAVKARTHDDALVVMPARKIKLRMTRRAGLPEGTLQVRAGPGMTGACKRAANKPTEARAGAEMAEAWQHTGQWMPQPGYVQLHSTR